MRNIKRPAALTALAVATLLALTGCMKLDFDVTVNADDTIDGTMTFGVEKEAIEMMGDNPDDPTIFDDMLSAEGMTVTPFADDDFAGVNATFDRTTFAELAGKADEGAFQFTHEGDLITFTGMLGEDSEAPVDFTALGLSAADARISVTFPGPVTESNGTVDGNTVTWKGDMSKALAMTATAKDSPSGGGAVLIVYGVGALVAIGGVIGGVLWVRRRDAVAAVDESEAFDAYGVDEHVPAGESAWTGRVPDDLESPYED